MILKRITMLFLILTVLSGISFASETTDASTQVANLINSPQGKQLYNLEVSISIQKKQNELLKLKEEAIKMQKEIQDATTPPNPPVLPASIPSGQFPSKEYFAPSPGFQGAFSSILKNKKKKIFQVMMVEKNINALIKNNGVFHFVKIGDGLDDGKVTGISGYGITLNKKGVSTFYPLSVIIPDNEPTLPLIKK
ncbi:MAG: pilus assembly protein PilP [Candidatus Omnitrophica bacterium]|nr:pilus assembly protein PilP [Candidatus Omnitrophota bacterium]